MFKIKRGSVEKEAKTPSAKSTPLQVNQTVFDALKLMCVNFIDEVTQWPVYNAAHWTCNIDRWLANLAPTSNNKQTYARGEIVFLDLGAQNFKHEPSYTHACIVLANRATSILIVPCSTKKFASGYPDIIDATPAEGFHRNTGIQSESFRWVHKNRVVSQTGNKVDPAILDKLDQVLLTFAPSIKKEIRRLTAENQKLNEQILELQKRIAALTPPSQNNFAENEAYQIGKSD